MRLETIKAFQQMSKNLTVLLVDDEVMLAQHYKDMIGDFFKSVELANSAQDALNMFKEKKYDIIYTDINMPKIDGIELIRTIKAIDKKQKFVVMSASNESEKLIKLLELNISGFILKPFTLDNFVDVSMDQVSIILQSRLVEEKNTKLYKRLAKITQEKWKQEQMLIQQSKLAQTGEMISMIAHQWRQPLSSMTTMLSSLKMRYELGYYDKYEDKLEAFMSDFDKAFETVEDSAMFLSKTINDFRDYYRPNNIKQYFDVCDAIKSVLSMTNMKKEGIAIDFKCSKENKYKVFGLEGELKQVIMSILNNAKDVLKDVAIDNPKITILVKKDSEKLSISVADNAGGIPEKIIDNIFLPYFSTKDKKNGTGLGLYMAKIIISEHMNGSLDVRNSKKFGGAEFIIKILNTKEVA